MYRINHYQMVMFVCVFKIRRKLIFQGKLRCMNFVTKRIFEESIFDRYINISYMSWNIFVKPKATVYYCCKLIYNHRISCKQITHANIEVTIESFSCSTITSLQQAGRGLPIS